MSKIPTGKIPKKFTNPLGGLIKEMTHRLYFKFEYGQTEVLATRKGIHD